MISDVFPSNPSKVINVGTISGGGAIFAYAWRTLIGLHNSGYELEWVGGSSTGCIVAWLYAKGFYQEAQELSREAYYTGGRSIFEPGVAKLDNGKIKVAFGELFKRIFKIKHLKSLMTNEGLYQTFLELDKRKPGLEKDMFFNTVSLQTGESTQHSLREILIAEERAAALTASTAIPGLFPLREFGQYKFVGDGGITDGLPFRQMFNRMDPMKDYQFFNVMCNPLSLMPDSDLDNIFKVIGRTVSIMLLEILKGDLERTTDRNEISKIIWPVTQRLEAVIYNTTDHAIVGELAEIVGVLRSALGFRNMPIRNLVYPGTRGTFEFTPESYEEQIVMADKVVSETVALLTSTPVAA